METTKRFSGFLSGAVAATSVFPLELLRIQQQALPPDSVYRSYARAIQHVYQKQGVAGFYKGLPHGILARGLFYGLYFPTYTFLKEHFQRQRFAAFGASYLAAGIGSVVCNPFCVVQVRRQTQVHTTGVHQRPTVWGIGSQEGWRALMRGIGFTWIKNVELGLIAPIRERLIDQQHSPMVSTFYAKVIAATLLYPLDSARTLRRHTVHPLSLVEIGHRFIQSPTSMYHGYLFYLFRSVPATVIAFTLHDVLTAFGS